MNKKEIEEKIETDDTTERFIETITELVKTELIQERYKSFDLGEFGTFGTVEIKQDELNRMIKIIIQVVNHLLAILHPKCPVYENLSVVRANLMIALENNTFSTNNVEIIYDYIRNYFLKIKYDISWCKSKIYLVDDDNIMSDYITEIMNEDLSLLMQHILEFNRLLKEIFVVNRYIDDYAD